MKGLYFIKLGVATILSATLLNAGSSYVVEEVAPSGAGSVPSNVPAFQGYETDRPANADNELIIPNSPILMPSKILTLNAVGMGVAPENTISPAQAMALAKRAAIVDAYRQLGEKMYGIRVNAKDTIKDMVSKDSTVKTRVMALIRNAEVTEVDYKDGLCQVQMEVKLDGRRWYRILSGRDF